ncbi:hypothetical protein LCGC14_0506700 [marine sediment metagenome]|uniref:Uncharacterized protein n=1 Tax=marine sediment metagenome TaxID=412755 RepID=A0A0F9S2F2_9ZZZZ
MTKAKATPTRRRRRRTTKAKVEEPEVVDETEEEEEVKAPPKKARRKKAPARTRKTTAKKVEEEVEPEEDENVELPKSLSKTLDGQFLFDLLGSMEQGQSLTIVRKSEDEWVLGVGGDAVIDSVTKFKRNSVAYFKEVLSPKYVEWHSEWQEMDYDEKLEAADDAGAEWEEHDDERVNLMRATLAYRKEAGIEKYKAEYSSPAARKAIVS